MIRFRWLALRVFFSLLAVPFVAFAVLWLLHEVVLPGEEMPDLPVVIITWGVVLVAVDGLLRHNGLARHNFLRQQAELALSADDNEGLETVFLITQKLFGAGLLSPGAAARLQNEARRQFLTFYEHDLTSPRALAELRAALREGYRREEIYQRLKEHVLSQLTLTIPLIDLAEELLEQHPDDWQLLEFMTRKFIARKARHHRAEYFYARYLTAGGEHAPAIVNLCLENVLAKERQDDFALWVYVRAFESGHSQEERLRRLLWIANQKNRRVAKGGLPVDERHQLAASISQIAESFAEEYAGTKAAVPEPSTPVCSRWRQRMAHAFLVLREPFLKRYLVFRRFVRQVYDGYRPYVLIGAGVLIVFFGLTVFWPERQSARTPVTVAGEDDAAGYFALQVGAWKKPRSAEEEKERLQQAGLAVRVLPPRAGGSWYRVHVGKYRSRRAAQAAADSLKRAGVIADFFVANFAQK